MKDYYDILNVLPTAEDIVIRSAYKALAQRYHPDKFQGDPAEAHLKMSEINEANSVLSDPTNRKAYDFARKRNEEESKPKYHAKPETPEPHPEQQTSSSHVKSTSKTKQIIGVLFLGSIFLYGLWAFVFSELFFNLLSQASSWSWKLTLGGFVIFAFASMNDSKVDKRFRTGYKDNKVPPPTPGWAWKIWTWPLGFFILSAAVLAYLPKPTGSPIQVEKAAIPDSNSDASKRQEAHAPPAIKEASEVKEVLQTKVDVAPEIPTDKGQTLATEGQSSTSSSSKNVMQGDSRSPDPIQGRANSGGDVASSRPMEAERNPNQTQQSTSVNPTAPSSESQAVTSLQIGEKSPEELCADRPNFISRNICIDRDCRRPEKINLPYCVSRRETQNSKFPQ